MEFTDSLPALAVSLSPNGTMIACITSCTEGEEGHSIKVNNDNDNEEYKLSIRDFGTLQVLHKYSLPNSFGKNCHSLVWSTSSQYVALVVNNSKNSLILYNVQKGLWMSIRDSLPILHVSFVLSDQFLLVYTDAAVHIYHITTTTTTNNKDGKKRTLLFSRPQWTATTSNSIDGSKDVVAIYHPANKMIAIYGNNEGSFEEYTVISSQEEGCHPVYVGFDPFNRLFAIYATVPCNSLAIMFIDLLLVQQKNRMNKENNEWGKEVKNNNNNNNVKKSKAFYRPRMECLGVLSVHHHHHHLRTHRRRDDQFLAILDGDRRLHVMNLMTRTFYSMPLSLMDVPPQLVVYQEIPQLGKYQAVYAKQINSRDDRMRKADDQTSVDCIVQMQFSPDCKYLAIQDGNIVCIVRLSLLGTLVWETMLIHDPHHPISSLQWHPSDAIKGGALFVTTLMGRNVFCWQPDGCRSLAVPSTHPISRTLQFRPQGVGEMLLYSCAGGFNSITNNNNNTTKSKEGGFCLAFPEWLYDLTTTTTLPVN